MPVNPDNRYDDKDLVRKLGELRAHPIKIATYQVKDPTTNEWSVPQIHFTYDNIVCAVMSETMAKLFHNYIDNHHPEFKIQAPPVLNIFFRPDGEEKIIHSTVTGLEVKEYRKSDLLTLGVYREHQPGGYYFDDTKSLDENRSEAGKMIDECIKRGYELITAFFSPRNMHFVA